METLKEVLISLSLADASGQINPKFAKGSFAGSESFFDLLEIENLSCSTVGMI